MSQRNRNLIDRITTWENLQSAFDKTAKGKRKSFGYLEFNQYKNLNLRAIQSELLDGSYRRSPFREFMVYEPKPRMISALTFQDRLVEHAICNVVEPIFDAAMLPYTFACRTGYGTHACVTHLQAMMRRTGATHYLQTDFSKYFASLYHPVLADIEAKKIHDARTQALMDEMLPHDSDRGTPIGSLLSKIRANTYGGEADRFLHHTLKQRHWVRYMDDIVVLGHDASELRDVFARLQEFCVQRLRLRISRWCVAPISHGVNFVGFRTWPGHKLLRKSSVVRMKRKIAACIKHGDTATLNKSLVSWLGHAKWADSENLITHLENRYGIACHQYAR
ncbi:reverse transcriptase/maturase family protein [Castellaniella sp. FW104-16D08]|uniref:reverse transcriptase/maturase family protein n=1 Tax=unclassified Castellaniella TaxID=2617606 RepID=UPI003314D2F4